MVADWASSVPGAMRNLVSILQAAPALHDVAVLDGPTVTGDAISEAVTIGYDDGLTGSAVTSASEAEGISRARDQESYTINCAVEVLMGSSADLPAARERAYAILAVVGKILAVNQTLNRAVMIAQLGQHSLSQGQPPEGALARIIFGVDCEAFTRA